MRFPLIVMCSMHHNKWKFVIARIIRQYYAISLKQVVSNAKMYENYTENLEKFRVKCYTTITNREEKRKKKITDIDVWEQEVSPLGTPESFHQYDSGNT